MYIYQINERLTMTTIKISANTTVATIDIDGVIGSESQGGDAVTSYSALKERLQQIEELKTPVVVVNIRSVGGDVADALLIYDALSGLDAHITTRCYGYTASAATIIAQAANEGCREIADSALYLIHNSSCVAEGNAVELQRHVELLQKTDERIAAIYASHSDKGVEHFRALMAENGGEGLWLSPEQALEAGLVDVIIKPEKGVTKGLIDRIAQWLGIKPKGGDVAMPTDRANLRPQPPVLSSPISLVEGQRAVAPTRVKAVEDPGLQGELLNANTEAYNRDAMIFRN